MTPAEQARAFAVMAACGAMLGAAHDALRPLRCTRALAAAADLALGVLGAALVVAAALQLRCDAFRLYVLLAVMLGFLIYMKTLGTIVRILEKRLSQYAKKSAG